MDQTFLFSFFIWDWFCTSREVCELNNLGVKYSSILEVFRNHSYETSHRLLWNPGICKDTLLGIFASCHSQSWTSKNAWKDIMKRLNSLVRHLYVWALDVTEEASFVQVPYPHLNSQPEWGIIFTYKHAFFIFLGLLLIWDHWDYQILKNPPEQQKDWFWFTVCIYRCVFKYWIGKVCATWLLLQNKI